MDPYSGKKHKGGATVEVDAPLEKAVLFLKDGVRLPIAG
jgi:alpha-glucosidase (family GH31 glycosyl hydrolase)